MSSPAAPVSGASGQSALFPEVEVGPLAISVRWELLRDHPLFVWERRHGLPLSRRWDHPHTLTLLLAPLACVALLALQVAHRGVGPLPGPVIGLGVPLSLFIWWYIRPALRYATLQRSGMSRDLCLAGRDPVATYVALIAGNRHGLDLWLIALPALLFFLCLSAYTLVPIALALPFLIAAAATGLTADRRAVSLGQASWILRSPLEQGGRFNTLYLVLSGVFLLSVVRIAWEFLAPTSLRGRFDILLPALWFMPVAFLPRRRKPFSVEEIRALLVARAAGEEEGG